MTSAPGQPGIAPNRAEVADAFLPARQACADALPAAVPGGNVQANRRWPRPDGPPDGSARSGVGFGKICSAKASVELATWLRLRREASKLPGSASQLKPAAPMDERTHLMIYRNEDELKKALQISSWKNLSKDKLVGFVSMMPDMDKEVALKVIEQFLNSNASPRARSTS